MMSLKELQLRAALLRNIRSFFFQQKFLEVDTPIRHPLILPESNIQPLKCQENYLQTSPESCMKRLLAHGCDRIFQVCPCFRKEEKGKRHLEEFTMLEWYRSKASYTDLMQDCLDLLYHLIREMAEQYPELSLFGSRFLCSSTEKKELARQKISVAEAFTRWSPVTLEDALKKGKFDEILVEYVEPNLGIKQVTFLYDYPASMASLARKKDEAVDVAERFELYLEGVEIANGFSELTDPVEQRSRFQNEIEMILKLSGEKMKMPEKFLATLEHLPDCAGIALGVDRLLMLIMGKEDVNEAVSFSPDDL